MVGVSGKTMWWGEGGYRPDFQQMPPLFNRQEILNVEHQRRARVDVHLVRVRVARVVVGLERDEVGVEARARQAAQWGGGGPVTGGGEEPAEGVGQE